jgi:hypothetical protein
VGRNVDWLGVADRRGAGWCAGGLPVVEMVGSTWHQTTPDDGDYSPGGVWVLCGPFEAYEARPVVTEAEELEVHRLMMRLRDLARGQELAR